MTFIEKLNAIQSEVKAPKNQYNKFGGYKYRSCEDILEAVKPLLAKYGCVLNISDDVRVMGTSETDVRFYIRATAEISDGTDSINTTAYAREPLAKKGMDDSQITGTASSYARKYALNGLFCIDDTKDADTMDNRNADTESKIARMKEKIKLMLDSLDPAVDTSKYANYEKCDDVEALTAMGVALKKLCETQGAK
jgi:hypothetical protein